MEVFTGIRFCKAQRLKAWDNLSANNVRNGRKAHQTWSNLNMNSMRMSWRSSANW